MQVIFIEVHVKKSVGIWTPQLLRGITKSTGVRKTLLTHAQVGNIAEPLNTERRLDSTLAH